MNTRPALRARPGGVGHSGAWGPHASQDGVVAYMPRWDPSLSYLGTVVPSGSMSLMFARSFIDPDIAGCYEHSYRALGHPLVI